MELSVLVISSFLLLSSISWYISSNVSLSVHLLINVWGFFFFFAPSFWLLWIKLLQTFIYMSSGGCIIYLGKYLRTEPLCHTGTLFNFVRLPLFFFLKLYTALFFRMETIQYVAFFFFYRFICLLGVSAGNGIHPRCSIKDTNNCRKLSPHLRL